MALKQIPQNEQIRITDDFWINGAFDDSGQEAVITISRTLFPGEQYLIDLDPSGVLMEWNETLHFYQISTTPGTSTNRHLFMIEANLDGLRWFPTPPGLIRDFSHIVLHEIDTLSGEIDHIIDDSLINKNLTPYQWHRALGSYRAWMDINSFANLPLSGFLDHEFSVASSSGVVTFAAEAYNLSEENGDITVPVRRQYGSSGSISVNIDPSNEIAPLSHWLNMGPGDYYADLTGVAYSPSGDYAIAISPNSGEILQGNSAGWVPHDTNGTSNENLKLTGITHDGTNFWACSREGKIYNSADGINWSVKYAPLSGAVALFRIIHLPNAGASQPALIAVGADGRIVYDDPIDGWQISPTNSSKKLFSVAFDGAEFVAVGEDATILTSTDLGIGWQASSNTFQTNLYSVTYAPLTVGSGFYVVGENGVILYASDTSNGFTKVESGTKRSLFSISFSKIETDPAAGTTVDYLIACGAGGTVCVSEEGSDFDLRRGGINRASALYAATSIEDTNGITHAFVTVGEYGARVSIETVGIGLSGDLQNINVDGNSNASVSWASGESNEKLVVVEATSVGQFREQIQLCIKRPITGSGTYRIGRKRTEINLMDSIGTKVFITPNFGPLLYITNNRVELNLNNEWEFKFSVGNTSNTDSGKLFLRFEGTNLPDWSIPQTLLPGSGNGIQANSLSGDIVHIIRQPVEAVSLYEEFSGSQPVLKYRQIVNSLWVSPNWSPNGIFPRSLGIYLQDDGSLTNPGIPGIIGSGGSI